MTQGHLTDGVVGLAEQAPNQQMVVVPSHPGAGGQLILEARRDGDDLVLPAFSSVRALVAGLGQSQPWAVMPLPQVVQHAAAGGIDKLILDPEVTDDAWRWKPADLNGFSWQVN